MNDIIEQSKLNPSGFKDSVSQTEIKVIDVNSMIPQGAPSAPLTE